MKTRTAVVTTIASAMALAAAAPILGQSMQHPGGGTATPQNAVAINDAGYLPATVVVAPGTPATWTNNGINPHTVTSDTGAFDSGVIASKAKFELTAPAATGTYAYHCTLHVFMRGTLVVSNLTLEGPKVVLVGKTASVHGASPGGVAGTPVVLESFAAGTWTPIGSTALAADGTFHLRTAALTRGAELRARIGEDISPTVEVPVAPKVTVKRVRRAGAGALAITVTPARAGKGKLERLNLNTFRWAKVRSVTINRRGRATVTVPKSGGKFRVTVLAAPAAGLASASSPALSFR